MWLLEPSPVNNWKVQKKQVFNIASEQGTFFNILISFLKACCKYLPSRFLFALSKPPKVCKGNISLSAQETIHYILEYKFCPSEGYFHWSLVKIFSKCFCPCNCCLTVEFVGRSFLAQILLQTVKGTTVFMVHGTGVLHVVGAVLQSSDLKITFF